ncbi:hypothetical protein C8J57DRAFT_1287751, partial [Mycena rebaudengoi]
LPPRVVRAPELFDPAKHPNCRLTELFAQEGFARVTFDQIDRMFDAAGHSNGVFFFDFYDRGRGLACNAPRGYELEILAPGGLTGPIQSVEAVYGIEAPEGLEKFTVVELTTCSLARPGIGSFRFDVPRRTRYRPLVAQPVRDPYM